MNIVNYQTSRQYNIATFYVKGIKYCISMDVVDRWSNDELSTIFVLFNLYSFEEVENPSWVDRVARQAGVSVEKLGYFISNMDTYEAFASDSSDDTTERTTVLTSRLYDNICEYVKICVDVVVARHELIGRIMDEIPVTRRVVRDALRRMVNQDFLLKTGSSTIMYHNLMGQPQADSYDENELYNYDSDTNSFDDSVESYDDMDGDEDVEPGLGIINPFRMNVHDWAQRPVSDTLYRLERSYFNDHAKIMVRGIERRCAAMEDERRFVEDYIATANTLKQCEAVHALKTYAETNMEDVQDEGSELPYGFDSWPEVALSILICPDVPQRGFTNIQIRDVLNDLSGGKMGNGVFNKAFRSLVNSGCALAKDAGGSKAVEFVLTPHSISKLALMISKTMSGMVYLFIQNESNWYSFADKMPSYCGID